MEYSFYKARGTLIEMLADRGYTHDTGLQSLHKSPEEFAILYKNSGLSDTSGIYPTFLDIVGVKTKTGEPVYVRVINGIIKDKKGIFDRAKPDLSQLTPIATRAGIELVKDVELEDQRLVQSMHIIVVYIAGQRAGKYDSQIETAFADFTQIEAFPVHKLTYNVTKHVLVNPHRMLTEEERNKVFERFNASRQMFSKICLDDPVNKYYGGKAGDMYEISRGGYLPSFRVVVSRTIPVKK